MPRPRRRRFDWAEAQFEASSATTRSVGAADIGDGGQIVRRRINPATPIVIRTMLSRFFDENVGIHHIFPKVWCKGKVDDHRIESFVNKTAIAARTNRIIGDNAPSDYLAKLQLTAGISEARMDEILESHLIEPVALRLDDFDEFFKQRSEDLLVQIEKTMGKPILPDRAEFVEESEFVAADDAA